MRAAPTQSDLSSMHVEGQLLYLNYEQRLRRKKAIYSMSTDHDAHAAADLFGCIRTMSALLLTVHSVAIFCFTFPKARHAQHKKCFFCFQSCARTCCLVYQFVRIGLSSCGLKSRHARMRSAYWHALFEVSMRHAAIDVQKGFVALNVVAHALLHDPHVIGQNKVPADNLYTRALW